MHAAQLSQLIAITVLVLAFGRFVVRSLDRAEHGFASLFVPPDRTLGWPHGIQESDEPWAWRAGADAHPTRSDSPDDAPDRPGDPTLAEPAGAREGALIVPVAPVAPIHFAARAH